MRWLSPKKRLGWRPSQFKELVFFELRYRNANQGLTASFWAKSESDALGYAHEHYRTKWDGEGCKWDEVTVTCRYGTNKIHLSSLL